MAMKQPKQGSPAPEPDVQTFAVDAPAPRRRIVDVVDDRPKGRRGPTRGLVRLRALSVEAEGPLALEVLRALAVRPRGERGGDP